jgi:hypothetical protein
MELAGIHKAISSKSRVTFTETMKARQRIAGAPEEGENVSALIQALHHWKEQTVSK